MRGPVEALGQPAVESVGHGADEDQRQRRPVIAGIQGVDGRPDERDAHQADEIGKVPQHGNQGRRRNAIVPPAWGSIRSKRILAWSVASSASVPPRVTTLNVLRVPAASASCTLRTPGASARISAVRAYSFSPGTPSISTSTESSGVAAKTAALRANTSAAPCTPSSSVPFQVSLTPAAYRVQRHGPPFGTASP